MSVTRSDMDSKPGLSRRGEQGGLGVRGVGGGKALRSALNPSLELSPAVKRRGGDARWGC